MRNSLIAPQTLGLMTGMLIYIRPSGLSPLGLAFLDAASLRQRRWDMSGLFIAPCPESFSLARYTP